MTLRQSHLMVSKPLRKKEVPRISKLGNFTAAKLNFFLTPAVTVTLEVYHRLSFNHLNSFRWHLHDWQFWKKCLLTKNKGHFFNFWHNFFHRHNLICDVLQFGFSGIKIFHVSNQWNKTIIETQLKNVWSYPNNFYLATLLINYFMFCVFTKCTMTKFLL